MQNVVDDQTSKCNTKRYGGPESHSLIYGSHVRTPMINRSTIDGWIFQPAFTIEQHSTLTIDIRWLDIQTTHYQAVCTLQRSTVDGWTLKPLMIEQYSSIIRVRMPLNGDWFECPTIDVSIIYGPTINH